MVIRDEWLVSFDYAIVIHSIHSMLKNSIHSIQKLMNGPTASSPDPSTFDMLVAIFMAARVWPV